MEEKIIRPTTKPEAIKGKLLKYQGTDYCEFMPQAQGEPQYEGISKTRHRKRNSLRIKYLRWRRRICVVIWAAFLEAAHFFRTFAVAIAMQCEYNNFNH